jgi:DnaJ-class molecular chaperone
MVKDTKLYEVLGVTSEANDKDIMKAYYKLSKIWHPDKHPEETKEEATKKFQEITNAKDILTDPEKKEMYDRFGTTNPNEGPNINPEDLFGQMFNMGGMNMPGMPSFFNQNRGRQQEDCILEHLVTLDDLYNNKTVTVKYNHKVYCNKCNATGTKDGKSSTCSGCNGSGQKVRIIRQGPMIQQMVSGCDDCQGTGEKVSRYNQCPECMGNKHVLKETSTQIDLSKNMTNNQRLLVQNKGHILKDKTTNLIIILKEQPHPIFKRQGNDLHIDVKLRLFQSIYGFTKMITHLDGRNVLIKYDKMIRNMNTLIKVSNEGMSSTGTLYIHISTCMPKIEKLEENENIYLKKLLVKAHLAEYQKEQNILKNLDKLHVPHIEEIDSEETEEDPNDENSGNSGPSVQCAQQ